MLKIKKTTLLLDWLNFFIAGVAMAVGPFLGAYLYSIEGWTQGQVGIALSIVGLSTLAFQTPAGFIVDKSQNKIVLFVMALASAGFANLLIALSPKFWIALMALVWIGLSMSFLAPSVAAISLGIVGGDRFGERVGRNEAFVHTGNILAALITGIIAEHFAPMIFCFSAAMSFVTAIIATRIPQVEIDNFAAREAAPTGTDRAIGFFQFFMHRKVLLLAVCFMLFQFANSPMLVLVGQRLTQIDPHSWSIYQSWCVVLSQIVTVPTAIFSGRLANKFSLKSLMMIGFICLPVRGILFTLCSAPKFFLAVQSLDGLSAGIFGVVNILMIRKVSRGTGRFNAACGFVATLIGVGNAISNTVAGYVAEHFGFNISMAFLSMAAIVALVMMTLYKEA